MDKKQFGIWAEEQTVRYLAAKGYKILARNWHCRFGELDIVAKKDQIIHFIEVKARRQFAFGFPEESLTAAKQHKLLRAITGYLAYQPNQLWQLDLVIIEQRGEKYYLQLFENVG